MKHLEEKKRLLDHIHENPESTQRELVEKLDISLGKVNFLLKALVDKGIIKLERFKNSRRKAGYLYIITPKGLAEKSRMTADFLKRKLKEYDKLKEDIVQLKLELQNIQEE